MNTHPFPSLSFLPHQASSCLLALSLLTVFGFARSPVGAQEWIEAEDYSDQSGTQLTSGGTAVGYIQAGDHFGFADVTLPETFDSIEISLSVPAGANDPDDRIILTWGGPDGLKLAYLSPSPTGGWRDFQSQVFNAGALSVYGGNTADFYFTFEGSGYIVDIDKFRFVDSSNPTIEGENYDDQSGTRLTNGGQAVGYIQAGDYMGYELTLPDEFDSIEITLAVPFWASDPDDRIILTWGGAEGLKLAYLQPTPTLGWLDFQTQVFNAGALPIYAGSYSGAPGPGSGFYLTFEGSGYIVDIDSFRFFQSGE